MSGQSARGRCRPVFSTGEEEPIRLHRQYLIECAEIARGAEWVAAHRRLLDEQLDVLSAEGVVLDDLQFQAAPGDGRSVNTLAVSGTATAAHRPRAERGSARSSSSPGNRD